MRPSLASAVALVLVCGCKPPPSNVVAVPYADNFDRERLGEAWTRTGGHWVIESGTVLTTGANNAPLFLNAPLPDDVVIEVDIKSETSAVDAKLELMTDGRKHQSGYIFILGGWKNKTSAIARLDEHGRDRKAKSPTEVKGNRQYHWRIEKKGGEIRWYLDGDLYMSYSDPNPLQGPGHDRLALSNWQNQLRYDNLRVWPYDQAPPRSSKTRREQSSVSTSAASAP